MINFWGENKRGNTNNDHLYPDVMWMSFGPYNGSMLPSNTVYTHLNMKAGVTGFVKLIKLSLKYLFSQILILIKGKINI